MNQSQRGMLAARVANLPSHRPKLSGSNDPLNTKPTVAKRLSVSVPTRVTLTMESEHGVKRADAIVGLRWILKKLLRTHHWKCLNIEEMEAEKCQSQI